MEKIQIGFRVLTKILYFAVLAICYLSSAYIIHLTTKDPQKRKKKFSTNAGKYTTLVCKLYNIKIEVINPPDLSKNGLIVGNHMGFVDILVMHSLTKALFVTSQEMREVPLLGLITEMSGCLFVERRSRTNILDELQNIIRSLKEGFSVTLYPEATSHNGEKVLPFKRTLLTAAAAASKPIIPYCFNFKSINNEPFTLKYRDHVCWYGDMGFFPSLIKTMSLKEIVA
ncbi:MAG: 1-acyl-sn-glycerol-3-phosphate acyltransferase, partial [Bdellovibrionales bacterium]|nr:1-acyl-sn-glycerol-3-phosphate acyltransferase [Bdellovibrionales bacterium]